MDIVDAAQSHESLSLATAISEALLPPAGTEYGPDWQNGVPYCRECGDVIPQARLAAMPGTGLCVDCAQEAQTSVM